MCYVQVIKDLNSFFEFHRKVLVAIYITGSYSRGDYNVDSDMDVILIHDNLDGSFLQNINNLKNKHSEFLDLKIFDFLELKRKGNFLLDNATLLLGIDIRSHIHKMNVNEKKHWLIQKTLNGVNESISDFNHKNISSRRLNSNIGWMMKTILFLETEKYIDEKKLLPSELERNYNTISIETEPFIYFTNNPTFQHYLSSQITFLKWLKVIQESD